MTEINEEVVYEIAQKYYGVIPVNAVQIRLQSDRQVWKLTDTIKGEYALKYLKKCDRAPIIAAANDYLHDKGIPVITVIPTLNGSVSANVNNGSFLLFQWVAGEYPNYEEPGMIERIARLLAEFHEASQGYIAAGYPISNLRLDWNQIYKRKIKKMEKFREKASVSGDSFSKVYLNHLPWIQSRVTWVLERLPQTALSALLNNIKHDSPLGHGDYSHRNLLRSNNNKLTLIDLDTISIALPMIDISHLITCMNHELGAWSNRRFQLILNAYQQIRHLSPEEHELLLIDQIFPYKAIWLAERYFNDSRDPLFLHEFERCIEIDREKLADLGIGPL